MATAISLISESGLVMWIVYIVFSASCYKRTIGNALRVYLLYRYKRVYILLHWQCILIEPDLAPFTLHYFSWDATISFHQDLVLGVPGSLPGSRLGSPFLKIGTLQEFKRGKADLRIRSTTRVEKSLVISLSISSTHVEIGTLEMVGLWLYFKCIFKVVCLETDLTGRDLFVGIIGKLCVFWSPCIHSEKHGLSMKWLFDLACMLRCPLHCPLNQRTFRWSSTLKSMVL